MNGIFDFLHAFHAPSMTASLRDAVSAAGLVCTHGKDNPGLGAPNSLKLGPSWGSPSGDPQLTLLLVIRLLAIQLRFHPVAKASEALDPHVAVGTAPGGAPGAPAAKRAVASVA